MAEAWLKAELHVHTTESDGLLTPQQVVTKYEDLNYQVLAITDHDKFTRVTSKKLIIIPAMEWTYRVEPYGHILMYGLKTMPTSIADAKAQRAVMIYAHPFTWATADALAVASYMDGYESFNGRLAHNAYGIDFNIVPSWLSPMNLRARTAGSDAHRMDEMGVDTTQVYGYPCFLTVLVAIKRGRVRKI